MPRLMESDRRGRSASCQALRTRSASVLGSNASSGVRPKARPSASPLQRESARCSARNSRSVPPIGTRRRPDALFGMTAPSIRSHDRFTRITARATATSHQRRARFAAAAHRPTLHRPHRSQQLHPTAPRTRPRIPRQPPSRRPARPPAGPNPSTAKRLIRITTPWHRLRQVLYLRASDGREMAAESRSKPGVNEAGSTPSSACAWGACGWAR
jgi:hypothetical protein